MKYLVGILISILIIDIYLRFTNIRRLINFLRLSNEITNKVLVQKGVLTKEDINKARKEVTSSMTPRDYKKVKKDLLKLGVDINH